MARGQGQVHKKIRGQGQGQPFRGQTLLRPRTEMLEAKDQGHKRKCSLKKRVFTKIFQAIPSPKKKIFTKIFQALHKLLTIQKIVLSSSRVQANFRGLEASRPRPRTSKCVLKAKNVLKDSTSGKSIYLIVISKAKSQLISNSITINFNFLKDSMYLSNWIIKQVFFHSLQTWYYEVWILQSADTLGLVYGVEFIYCSP